MMQLQINGDPGQVVWLHRPNYLIGRSSVCNLRFRNADLELVHARLKIREGIVTLASQDNAPVTVNGVPINSEARLHDGDQIALGNINLVVKDTDQTKRETEAARGAATKGSRTAEVEAATQRTSSDAVWILHGLSSGLAGKRYTLSGSMVVGRGQACEIRLAEAHLSRCHARLTVNGGSLLVEDLESANGTFVNGRRIKHAHLKNGDELSLDTVKFRIIHALTEADSDATVLHGIESRQKPAPPVGPTAIDIQMANLRRMRESTEEHAAVERHAQRSGPIPAGGWLAVTVSAALAGALWSAKSFLGVPFLG